MVYKQIVRIPMDTDCALLMADLSLFCNERDFMSNLHRSKQYDFIDIFNDTCRYHKDIFTVDNPDCDKHIPVIYIQQNFN